MQIGDAADASGISAKLIRYYEEIRLIPSPKRRDSGYRVYEESDVHRLRFIHRARELGFPVGRIRELLQLWNDRKRPSREVKRVALEHIADMEAQIRRMRELAGTVRHFADACEGDSRPHCPILDELAGEGAEARPHRRRLRR
ncbi:MAG: Cu(I)-responsive transcriptional regulator [Hyphomicrobiales bacterium]